MRTLSNCCSVILLIMTIGVSNIRAQQPTQPQQPPPQQPQSPPTQPIPALRSPLASAADNSATNDADQQTLVPDTRPLAGAQDLSLGAPKTSHNYWSPYFDIGTTINSNPPDLGNNISWSTWTSIQGGINLHHLSGNSDFSLGYLGGGEISNNGGTSNSIVQQLNLVERLTYHRTVISFMDQLGYFPNASFGYYGLGGLTQTTVGGPVIQGPFTPNQSILTHTGQSINNTSLVQVNTYLTPRSSLTFIGSYGILSYFDNNLNNNKEAIFQVGYNHVLNRKDTISVLYRFDAFRYDNITQSIDSHSVQLAFARRVTGRMAFQISGGPVVSFSQVPITGSSGSTSGAVATGTTPNNTTQLFWALYTTLTYQWRPRTLFTVYFDHDVTGGSGVLAGSIADNFSGAVSRQLTHALTFAWTVGFSRNTGAFIPTTSTPPVVATPTNQTYDYWFTGVNLTRSWGRAMNVSLGYQFQHQDSNALFCVTTPCATSYASHQIFLSMGWHPQRHTY